MKTKAFTGKAFAIVLAVLMLICMMPAAAFAAGPTVSIQKTGAATVTQGETIYVEVLAQASDSTPYRLMIVPADSDIQVVSGNNGTFSGTSQIRQVFGVMATKGASEGTHDIYVRAVNVNDESNSYSSEKYSIQVNKAQSSSGPMDGFAVDFSFAVEDADSLKAGETQTIKVFLYNRGSSYMKNAVATVDLGSSGLTLAEGSLRQNLGYFYEGKTLTADYTVNVPKDIKTGSYPISVTVAGQTLQTQGTDVVWGSASVTDTFYIPVIGKGEEAAKEYKYEMTSAVDGGKDLRAGTNGTVTFTLKNTGKDDMSNIATTLSLPSGLSIASGSTKHNLGDIASGASATTSYMINVNKNAEGGSYPITVYITGMGEEQMTEVQYVPVQAAPEKQEEEQTGDKINPILMVSGYEYGTEDVQAGSDFTLALTLNNTSTKQLRNIKVTVTTTGDVFRPKGSSNSYYISSIPAGGFNTKNLELSCSGDAAQGPTSVSVAMAYQDNDGGSYTASDVISVPVAQQIRFSVDPILDPGWITADSQGYLSVNYYNKGKTPLYNLTITAEGDFTMDGNATNYVGTMQSGRSDYYNINFYPNQAGPMNGTITFKFEDAAGKEHEVVQEFTFNIGEAQMWDDPGMIDPMVPEKQGLPTWAKIAIPVAAVAVLAIVISIIKKRKKAKQEALELDE